MQNALDAATLSITTLPTSTSLADRQVKLQESFAANSGQGTAKLDGFVAAADGAASINASVSFAMPTNFMQIARVDTVQIGVASAVRKRPTLVQTTFKVQKVSGPLEQDGVALRHEIHRDGCQPVDEDHLCLQQLW
ncbi:hypothetical protein [Mesorhizobium prunaredense]|nr:hypothetical protein [Mesorhizobium prunaredense]